MFRVDGKEFTRAVVDKPKRSFQILDGENAGRQIIIAKMERDVLGTFYNYSMNIDSRFMTKEEYDELYEILSAPVDSHIIEVPYAQETLIFEAYVTNGTDELTGIINNSNIWANLSINFIAMEPQRRPAWLELIIKTYH